MTYIRYNAYKLNFNDEVRRVYEQGKNKTVVTVLTINVVVIIVIGLIVVGYFYKKRYDISELYMRITPEKQKEI